MDGAIFYASKYGSTADYARWIGEATGLPVFDLTRDPAQPSDYEFVVLAAPVIYHKLLGRRWVRRHSASLLRRPVLLVSVSGAGAGTKLDGWIAASFAAEFVAHAEHFALRGRQNPRELNLYDRVMLQIGGLMNRDPQARRDEMKGFDYMDKSSIAPVVDRIRALQAGP